jgi:hypothetical protein
MLHREVETGKMEVFVFGDQTAECKAFLKKACARKEDVLLQTFLEKAAAAIRVENLSRTHPTVLPNFGTILELVDRYTGENPDSAIESAIVCLAQFAHVFGYNPSILSSICPF